jgi:hypothetical protein
MSGDGVLRIEVIYRIRFDPVVRVVDTAVALGAHEKSSLFLLMYEMRQLIK